MKKFLKRMEKIIKAMEDKISVQKKGLGLLFSHNFDTLELIEKNLIDVQDSQEFKALTVEEKLKKVDSILSRIYKKTMSVHQESTYYLED